MFLIHKIFTVSHEQISQYFLKYEMIVGRKSKTDW